MTASSGEESKTSHVVDVRNFRDEVGRFAEASNSAGLSTSGPDAMKSRFSVCVCWTTRESGSRRKTWLSPWSP